ncbi:MAG: acetyl-CoA carboxylase carboxyltransferase subunit beta, partial [Planctomycetota bacterium JB042]
ERVRYTLDEGSFEELYTELRPVDRLDFRDKTSYAEKLEKTAEKVKRLEAMTIGTGTLHGREVVLGVMNFQFLGGSMGVVVGEKVTLAVEIAMERRLPLVLVCASGGARMHEGALSLMQMAKTCAALGRFADAGGLYIAVLTNPTTGGVTASFATMADVIIGEPGALIGFAGPRVIQNTIKQELPEGFQRSEFLLARGQIDRIVSRPQMKDQLFLLMEFLAPTSDEARPVSELLAAASRSTNGHAPAEGPEAEEAPAAKKGGKNRLPEESDEEESPKKKRPRKKARKNGKA